MVPLIKMIHSENIKIYYRKSTLLMLISIPAMVFLFASTGRSSSPPIENIWGLVGDQTPLLYFINIFTVIIAGGIVANEFNWGTIKLLLIRPAGRSKVLLAKYLTVILFSLLLTALLFSSALIVNLLFYGFKTGTGSLMDGTGGKVLLFNSLSGVLLLYIIKYAEILIYGTLALMLSVVSKSNALTIGVSLLSMIFGPELTYAFAKSHWAKYVLFANIDLVKYFNGSNSDLIPDLSLPFSLTMLLVYWAAFVIISWTVFMKRDVLN